jgi:cellulose synthase/poly-beta-1,6-N-acetylglucosamine synthase-like glycosyltransferase
MNIATILSNTITVIFLFVILSYYVFLFLPRKKGKAEQFKSITIVIPAHNEEKYLAKSIEAVLAAHFPGKKQVIVVDDGSKDATYKIAKTYPVTVLKQKHSGKSKSINRALKKATGELFAIVDGDSFIDKDALQKGINRFISHKVAAVCAVIKVANRQTPLGFWLHLEQMHASLTRAALAKVNSNIVTAGPLSIYRRSVIEELGGFGHQGFAEDADMAIRIIRAGYTIEYAEDAFTETNMPSTLHGFIRQRSRFARGTVNILKRHLKLDRTFWQLYTLPLAFFSYLQAVIMVAIMLINLVSGYITYFAAKGQYLNWWVAKWVVEWFSIVGVARWAWSFVTGENVLTMLAGAALAASLLTYPLYLIAVFRYEKRFTWKHAVAIALLNPFWMIVMLIYLFHIPEWLKKEQFNIWEKSSHW